MLIPYGRSSAACVLWHMARVAPPTCACMAMARSVHGCSCAAWRMAHGTPTAAAAPAVPAAVHAPVSNAPRHIAPARRTAAGAHAGEVIGESDGERR
eukprot:360555-Chlamydomonas_euryale.AAC.2